MALTRNDPNGALLYTNETFPASSTVAVGSLPDPVGGIEEGDQLILVIAQYIMGGAAVLSPGGFTQIASTPQDFSTGIDGTTIRLERMYLREADGSAYDTPTISVTSSSGDTANVRVHAVMFSYSGGKLEPYLSGSVSNTGIGGPTLPANVTSPPNGLVVSAAYQSLTYLVPEMFAANSFEYVYSAAQIDGLPVGLGISDYFPADGLLALPQWNVSRGSGAGEHHHAWALLRVADETQPGIRLSGLTFGHKRRRLGQPSGAPA